MSKKYTVNKALEDDRHLVRLHRRRRCRRRRTYAPTSNTASHDNHEKINSWVSFSFLYGYGAPLTWGDYFKRRKTLTAIAMSFCSWNGCSITCTKPERRRYATNIFRKKGNLLPVTCIKFSLKSKTRFTSFVNGEGNQLWLVRVSS